jgi:hypothetical protein
MLGGDQTRRELEDEIKKAKQAIWQAQANLKKAKKNLADYDKWGFRSNAP